MEHTGEDDWVEDIKVLIGITFKVQSYYKKVEYGRM